MKKYTVSLVRERLAQALDEAQRGDPVFIQRDDVLYQLRVVPARKTRPARKAQIEVLDAAVARGQWTWDWSPDRLKFKGRRKT